MTIHPELLAAIVQPRRVAPCAIGGLLRAEPEDFDVEEIPSYLPEGTGDHLFLWIEKRAFPTDAVGRELSRSLHVPMSEIGFAGLKDTVAVTRQFVSVPREAAEGAGWDWQSEPNALGGERFRILSVKPHGNKLRTGHLRGNRFRIVLRPKKGWLPEEIEAARKAAARIAETGVPNYYGAQRFGRNGSTLDLGLELLAPSDPTLSEQHQERDDERHPGRDHERHPGQHHDRHNKRRSSSKRISRNLRRLALSAVQSAVFNLVVADRLERGELLRAHLGDIFQVVASGGPFLVEDVDAEQPRLDRREVVPAGPMFGKKMKATSGVVHEWELSALQRMGLDESSFHIPGKLLLGTRRPMVIWPTLDVAGDSEGIVVKFELPKGSYATVVLRELTSEN